MTDENIPDDEQTTEQPEEATEPSAAEPPSPRTRSGR